MISAAHFVNEPEGGFIVVGDIQLRALVKNSCGVTGSADDQENDQEGDQEGDQEYEAEQPVPVGGTLSFHLRKAAESRVLLNLIPLV